MSEPPPHDRTGVFSPSEAALDSGLAVAFAPSSSSVLRALAAEMPQLPRVQLHEPDSGASSPVIRPSSDQMPVLHDPASRYQLLGEIARGGMGAVLKGRDVDLGRDIAVKVLLESHAGRTELLQRFVEEAQIAGQLQHPGIVPVYEMGRFPDKRPYFTMKLVKGQTLAKLLAARSVGPERNRPGDTAGCKPAAQDRARFLGIFLQVCQAMAYAHARGVIHRDLKPSNVMVGAFGEVQLMDWGLAKVLPQGGVADEKASRERERPEDVTAIRTRRSESSDVPGSTGTQTHTGTILGTPAYMAPEQALGEVDRLDERSDVFALGAILCQVLTGQPPYVGSDFHQVHRKAMRADLADAFARLDGCDADAELVALCKRCLDAEPLARRRNAAELADELSVYLQGVEQRLRHAELARAQAEVKAFEERKRRQVQLALAAALAGLLALGAAGGIYLQRQHEMRSLEQAQRQREVETTVATTMEKVEELRKQARWSEAGSLLEQARRQMGESAPESLRTQVDKSMADVELVGRLDAIRLRKATWVAGKWNNTGADKPYAEVFARHGLGREGDDPVVVAARVRESAVKEQLLAALDDWAFTSSIPPRTGWLMEIARRADPHPWRDRLRDPALWKNPKKLQALAAEARVEELSPQVAAALGIALGTESVLKLLRAMQRRSPQDFWVNFILGIRLTDAKQEAIGYLRVALALRPEASAVHSTLGLVLCEMGKTGEAIEYFRKAINIDSQDFIPHTYMGLALIDKGRVDEAIESCNKAIELNPQFAQAHGQLGLALLMKGKVEEAIVTLSRAVELKPGSAEALSNLGAALTAKGKVDEAIACYHKAIEHNHRNADAHICLGSVLCDFKRDYDGAIACFRKAIQLDPRNAMAHTNLGNALKGKGNVDDAIACYRKAIEIDP